MIMLDNIENSNKADIQKRCDKESNDNNKNKTFWLDKDKTQLLVFAINCNVNIIQIKIVCNTHAFIIQYKACFMHSQLLIEINMYIINVESNHDYIYCVLDERTVCGNKTAHCENLLIFNFNWNENINVIALDKSPDGCHE